jgi:hypothetical protein
MPQDLNSVRGLHSARGLQSLNTHIRTNTGSGTQNTDFLKLYMLDKERTRMCNEKIRLSRRMEQINNRLKEIEEYYAASLGKQNCASPEENPDINQDKGKMNFKTMSINY